MIQSADIQQRIAIWRAKAADGSLTQDEMKEAITVLRAGRMAAATSSSAARIAKAKAAIPSAEDLLDELGI